MRRWLLIVLAGVLGFLSPGSVSGQIYATYDPHFPNQAIGEFALSGSTISMPKLTQNQPSGYLTETDGSTLFVMSTNFKPPYGVVVNQIFSCGNASVDLHSGINHQP